MSVQNSLSNLETESESEGLIIRRLTRAIDYAEGFWLGFVKCNTRAQKRKAIAACKELLRPLGVRVVEIDLTEPTDDLLPILRERLTREASESEGREASSGDVNDSTGSQQKITFFVSGLEHSISSADAYPPILSSLNLKRELFRKQVPHPLALWLPDYALTALARKAPDFWAWRSGLYEFAPERELAEQSFAPLRDEPLHVRSNLSEQAKRERLAMLKGLLTDYRELGNNSHERRIQANILHDMGLIYQDLGEWIEARKSYEEVLGLAHIIGNKTNVATSLHQLGILAQLAGDYAEARRLYEESLQINHELGNRTNAATGLHNLGELARDTNDYAEARRLYEESLQIRRDLGDKAGAATTLAQLALLDEYEHKFREGYERSEQAERIVLQLGNEERISHIRQQRKRLEEKVAAEES